MNIQLPPGKHPNYLALTTSLLAVILMLLCLPRSVDAVAAPFYAHQFKLTCSPKVTSTNSPKNFSVPLPASYSSSYSRYLALSGYNAELKDKMFFKMFLGGKTNTAQTVVLIADASINMVILSIQLIFVIPNTWIWATNRTYVCSVINKYGWFSPSTETTFDPVPTTVNNVADFKVYPFLSWYHAEATPGWWGPNAPIAITLTSQLQNSSPPSIQTSIKRDVGTNQKIADAGYVIILVNQTELLIKSFPYNFYVLSSSAPFTTYPNLNISTMYVSSTFGGLNGNCLIGMSTIKLSGNYNTKVGRGPTFSATYPISNVANSIQPGDTYYGTYGVICFTGINCPTNKVWNPIISQCTVCGITSCTTCLTYAICKTCATQSAINASVCASCPLLSPGCLTCKNSTYCMSCLNNSYILNQNLCVPCANFMIGCDTCSNSTNCTLCLSTGFFANNTDCVPCSQGVPFCLNCTNDTVCLVCQDAYYEQISNGSCMACNTTLFFCNKCVNNTICLSCQIGYYLASNNTCVECNTSLNNCSICSDSYTCTSCEVGYYLSSSQCSICSSAPTLLNCLQCSSSTACTVCNTSYYLQANNTCSPCTNLPNCVQCTNSYTCVQCAINYLLSGTVCLPCLSVLSNCLTCDNSTYCTSCVSTSFFLSTTFGICMPCSISIINCDQCILDHSSGSMTCTSCIQPMVVNPNNTCLDCQAAIPNCGTCVNYTLCQNCINSSFAYFVQNNTCTPCSDIFRSCSQCTLDICTKCQEGFSLSPNSKSCNCLVGSYINGVCSTIPGCVFPFLYPDKTVGCSACDSVDFFAIPVFDHCQCRRGTLIAGICTDIKNCIAALIGPDGEIYCAFCNTTAGFKSSPENNVNCVCNDHLQGNGTYCLDKCGDGFLMNTTKDNCDDGNTEDGDGCSSQCQVQNFFRCQNGSSQTPSQCYYIGSQTKVSLLQIYKNQEDNQGIFQFKITPALKSFKKMDFSKYLSLDCNSTYTINSITYAQGIISVKADYTQDMEGVQCHFLLNFDKSVVRSPSIKLLPFNAVSDTLPLVISNYLNQIKSFKISFTTLSYVIAGVFALSLTHKMIGAELLFCTQIVYLSNCFYQVPSVYMSPLQNLNLVTGNWTFFYKNSTQTMFPPFSRRIKLSVYFLQNTLFVISALVLFFIILVLLYIYLKHKTAASQLQNPKLEIKVKKNRIFKALAIVYRSFTFPTAASFLMIILISGYIHNFNFNKSLQSQFSIAVNGISQMFAWLVFSLTMGFEIFGMLVQDSQKIQALVSETYAKKWYISLFILRVALISAIIQVGIKFTFSKLVFALALVQVVYLLITILVRMYVSALDNIGVISCVITQCFAVALPIISRFYSIPQSLFVMLVYALIALLVISILFAIIRIFIVMKNAIVKCKGLTQKSKKPKKNRQATQQLMTRDYTPKKITNFVLRDQIDIVDQVGQVGNAVIGDVLAKEPNQNLQHSSIYKNIKQEQIGQHNQDISFMQAMRRLKHSFKQKISHNKKVSKKTTK